MNVSGIDAVYYTVSDIEACTTFYRDLFGTDPQTTWAGRLAEWVFDDGNSFGIYGSHEATKGESGSAMFAVADIAQAVAEAKARGVTFAQGGEITQGEHCDMAFGEDPEGNQFILHHRK